MNFIKGLALALLSCLLFLSLSIFGLVLTLNYTILNPDFAVSELDKLDIPSLIKPLIREQVREQLPAEAQSMAATIDATIDDVVDELEPWIREQASNSVYSGYDYLLGKSQSLSLVIHLEPVKESLKDNLRELFFESLPPELQALPPAEKEAYFAALYRNFSKQIPPTFELTESSLPPEVVDGLEQAKQAIGYVQLAYKALAGLVLLLILGIILINRQVRGASRGLGTTFLTCGAFEYAGIFVAKQFAGPQLSQLDIPAPLQTWLPQLMNDFLAPLQIFSIGLMAAGVVLVIVSLVYRPSEPSF